MSTARLIRYSASITILAGLLYAIGALLHPVGEDLAAVNNPSWIPSHMVYWVSVILLHIGLVGLYAHQAEKMGRLGLLGFVLAFIGTALVGSILLVVSTIIPLIATETPQVFEQAMTLPNYVAAMFVLGFGLGYILFGLATMRAGVLPRWSGLLLVIGVTLFIISEMVPLENTLAHMLVTIGDILFGLGLVWMGYTLGRTRKAVTEAKSASGLSAP